MLQLVEIKVEEVTSGGYSLWRMRRLRLLEVQIVGGEAVSRGGYSLQRFFEERLLEVHQYLPGHTAVLSDAEEAVLQLDFVLDVMEADGGATGLLPLLHRAEGGGGTLQSVFGAYVVQHGDVNVAHFLDHFHTTACILSIN